MRKKDFYALVVVISLVIFSLYALVIGSMYNLSQSPLSAAVDWFINLSASDRPADAAAANAPPAKAAAVDKSAGEALAAPSPHKAQPTAASSSPKPTIKAGEGKKTAAEEVF